MARSNTILVVDPDPTVRELISDVLTTRNRFVVHGAEDGDQALQAAREFLPDLVIIESEVAATAAGRRLVTWAQQGQVTIPVLRLVSGIPDPVALQEVADLHGFDLPAFLTRVHELLGVELSAPPVAYSGEGEERLDEGPGPGQGKTVLIVEDLPEIRMLLAAMLTTAGYTVTSAVDGPSGLAAARTTSPDLVILDHQMPGLTGLQVLMTLRAEGSKLPIILLTAYGHGADNTLPWSAWKSGVSLYMDKPFDMQTLLRWVDNFTHEQPHRDRESRVAVESFDLHATSTPDLPDNSDLGQHHPAGDD